MFAPTGVLALLRSLAFRFMLWGVGVFEEACLFERSPKLCF